MSVRDDAGFDLFAEDRLELLDLLLAEEGLPEEPAGAIPRRPDPTEHPLSFAQQRLWFLDQWQPGSAAYNVSSAYRLTGALDLAVLARVLAEVVRRHEVLRSTIRTVAGRPVQEIALPGPFLLPVVDLTALAEAARGAESARLVAAAARRPFDLATGPLLRVAALSTGPAEHVLLLVQHHIVSDGWSMGVLVREIVALYAAFAAGEPSPLPEPPIQYADFAAWQRRRGDVLMAQLAWWRERLAGAPELLELPVDRPRPAVRGQAGAVVSQHLPGELARVLAALGQRAGATPFMTLLAAFQAFLARLGGVDDLVVGTPVANRTHGELEGLIGFFVNTLALYADLAGDPPFTELLARVRATTLGAYDHQDVPFEMLVEELAPARELSHTPIFQVLFALQNTPLPTVELSDLTLAPLPAHSGTAKFDLTLSMEEGPDGLYASWEYATDLFERSTIERLSRHFATLLDSIAEDPGRRLSELALLTAEEAGQLAAESRPAATFPAGYCLHELFAAQARRTPATVAVTCGPDRLTYAELDQRSDALAVRLAGEGAGPESIVGLLAERSLDLVTGILGILKAGAAYLPLDPSYPDERLRYMLEDAGSGLLVVDEELGGRAAGWGRLVPISEPSPPGPLSRSPSPPTRERGNEMGTVLPEHPAYVIYTSGSTGRPKGVVVTHADVVRLFAATRRWFEFDGTDVWTLFHSSAFDFSVWELWGALLHGGRLVVVPYLISRSPEDLLRLLAAEGATVLNQTPSAFRQLSRAAEAAGEASQLALRCVVFGGEALELQSLRPWIERHGDRRPRLVNMYGITETTVHVTYREIRLADLEAGAGSVIGVPIPDLSVAVLDARGGLVPIGVAGEMHVGGAGLARGYLGRPDLTAERFVPDPFAAEPGARLYRSGDLARRRAGGELEYLGRIDHQVKIRGFRIELGEIEAVIAEHPEVAEAAVLAREEGGETRLVAWVVPRSGVGGAAGLAPALRTALRSRLPDYMVPSAFVPLAALPLTPNGKLDRAALPAPEATRPDLDAAFVAPRTPAEELLAAIWEPVLGVDGVGVHDNFFALGGDSIRSVQVLAMARERGLELSIQDLFQHQTIAELAAGLAEAQAEAGLASFAGGPEPFAMVPAEDRQRLPADVVDAYPLTKLQEGMLFHMALRPEAPLYHNVNSWHLRGRFDATALQRAVDRVVARHAVLRTSFDLGGAGGPLQRVHREASLPVGIEDLSHLAPAAQEAAIEEHIRRERGRLFDLSRPPQLRLHVHRRGADAFQLTLTENHAIFDGWSLHATLTEIFRHYTALLAGEPRPEEPPPPVAFRDFVRLERAAIESAETRGFWAGRLAGSGFTAVPRWPGARPELGAAEAGPGVGNVALLLPADLLAALARLARQAAVPVKSVFLAAHLAALARVAGEDDVVTGVVSHGRPEVAGGEEVRGLFLNTVPFRLSPGPGSWRDLVSATFAAEWEMLPHRRYPLAVLQEERGGRPLFETGFNYIHFHVAEAISRPGGLAILGGRRSEGNDFTLMANFSQTPGTANVVLDLDFNARELALPQVRAIAGRYLRALTAMAAAPEAAVRAADLLSAAERRQLLAEWNDTGRVYPDAEAAGSIPRLFAQQAARTPEAIALVFEGERLTYRETKRRVDRLARRLRTAGVGPDAVVAVCAERSLDMVVALLAVLEAGGAYLPLDPELPPERLAFLVADARPAVVLAEERYLPRLPTSPPYPPLPSPSPRPGEGGKRGDAEPESSMVLLPSPGRGEGHGSRAGGEGLDLLGESAAYVIYTSGSTGRPKGVVVPHRGILNRLLWMQETYGLGPADRVLQKTPFSFDVSVWEFFWPLVTGAGLVVARPGGHRDAAYLVDLIAAEGITTLHFVPSMLQAFLEAPGLERCRSLERVIASGEALPAALAERFFARLPARIELHNLYGPTEASVDVTSQRCEREGDLSLPAVPIGRPVANTAVVVLDRELRPAPIGTPGELFLGGVQLARGYLARPDLTAERFVPAPWGPPGARLYRTGDLARTLPDGAVEFLGRLDFQVKIRGFRVEPGEIEAALLEHPEVREAVVAARRETGDVRLAAWVTGTAALEPASLRAFLAARLPEHMVPSAFVVLDALPLTASGKVDRKALPAPGAGAARPSTGHVPPRDGIEAELAAIWARLLGVERVGVHDDFFELGGHSLLAHRVLAAVRESFAVEVGLRALYEQPTIAGLAAVVAAEKAAASAPALPPPPPITRLPRRAGEVARFPVSFSQLREWILDQLDPGTAAYNIPGSGRVTGPLSVAVLAASVDEIVRRHESLRTTFVVERGDGGRREPVQVVAPRLALTLPVADLAGLPAAVREAEARRLARAEIALPFDLARGPLLRVGVVRLAEREHLVLFTMHHIVSDGWSMSIFFRELGELYAAFAAGRPSPLPELPVQYADYAAWQRGWLTGEVLASHLDAWQRRLAGAPPLLALPTDRPRPPVQTFRGAHQPFRLDPERTAALRDLGRRERTSLFVVVLAAFQTLLARWSGQEDLTVGTYSGARGRTELEGLIGFFINTLALRGDLTGDPSFRALVGRLREVTLEAYAHQDVPFERLLESLRLERSLAHTPLFQVLLVLQSFPAAAIEASEVTLATLPIEDDRANFDLALWLDESGGGLAGSFEHNTDLFEPATVRRMAAQLAALAAAAAADPDRPLSDLPLLSAAESHQLLVEWNDTAGAEDAAFVHRLAAASAGRAPEAVALVAGEFRVTYRELWARACALAGRLRGEGVGPEVVVGVCLERSPELIVALLAVLEAGGAYLPLDPDYPTDRLAFMLEDAAVPVVVTRERLLPGLSALGGRRAVCFEAEGSWSLEGEPAPPALDPDHPAYVIYTSGSTGRPKGVVVRHGSLARHTATAGREYAIGPGDRVLQFASPSFDTSAEEIYPCLARGATLVLRAASGPEDPAEFLRGIERLGVTVLDLPTAYWHELVAALERGVASLPPGVRLVILGGERALPGRVRAWRAAVGERARLVNTYGPTEGTIVATHADLTAPSREELAAHPEVTEVPIGRPIQGARAVLLDRTLRPVPLGAYGELCIGGAGLARGYLGRPDLTAERFVPDPFAPLAGEPGARLYRTGDLARHRADGRLEFGGRIDQQVKVRGFRVEPGEVEAALAAHPEVAEAAVAARPDVIDGSRLVAWVALHPEPPGATAPPAGVSALKAFLRERLPEHMVPSAVVLLPALPHLPNGKVDRRGLPAPDGGRPGLEAAYVAPETELERVIAGVFAGLLRLDKVGRDDNFFDLGAHSLLLVEAQGRLTEALGREVAVVDLFRFPTVALLARHLGGADAGATAVKKAQSLAEQQKAALGRRRRAMEIKGKPKR